MLEHADFLILSISILSTAAIGNKHKQHNTNNNRSVPIHYSSYIIVLFQCYQLNMESFLNNRIRYVSIGNYDIHLPLMRKVRI